MLNRRAFMVGTGAAAASLAAPAIAQRRDDPAAYFDGEAEDGGFVYRKTKMAMIDAEISPPAGQLRAQGAARQPGGRHQEPRALRDVREQHRACAMASASAARASNGSAAPRWAARRCGPIGCRRPKCWSASPELPRRMEGGPDNPLGPRAHYLYRDGKDLIYRIHGTTEPWTIGTDVSSGCIRMLERGRDRPLPAHACRHPRAGAEAPRLRPPPTFCHAPKDRPMCATACLLAPSSSRPLAARRRRSLPAPAAATAMTRGAGPGGTGRAPGRRRHQRGGRQQRGLHRQCRAAALFPRGLGRAVRRGQGHPRTSRPSGSPLHTVRQDQDRGLRGRAGQRRAQPAARPEAGRGGARLSRVARHPGGAHAGRRPSATSRSGWSTTCGDTSCRSQNRRVVTVLEQAGVEVSAESALLPTGDGPALRFFVSCPGENAALSG